MAAALDTGAVHPLTTFTDTGVEVIDGFRIKNAADKVYGLSTMTDVLAQSINTGAIYAARLVGSKTFADYVERFGFGRVTGIELDTEVTGTIENARKKNDIYLATSSFGQGITTTPMQLITAYAALANGGKLLKPTIVKKIVFPDGSQEDHVKEEIRQIVSPRTSAQISSMLTAVVSEGHAKKAGVKGYLIAGKTGTAQIAHEDGGYGEEYNHTFIGYGPADDARFVMLVKFEKPNVSFAASTAVSTFGIVAQFLVNYLHISPGV